MRDNQSMSNWFFSKQSISNHSPQVRHKTRDTVFDCMETHCQCSLSLSKCATSFSYLQLVRQHQRLGTSEKGISQKARNIRAQSFCRDHTMMHWSLRSPVEESASVRMKPWQIWSQTNKDHIKNKTFQRSLEMVVISMPNAYNRYVHCFYIIFQVTWTLRSRPYEG